MKMTMLGTGHAFVVDCYNTCFVLEDNNQYFLVDGGGGGQLFTQLRDGGINWLDIHHIFVTHKHTDHLLGIVWMVRLVCQYMNYGDYKGDCWLYAHEEVVGILRDLAEKLFRPIDNAFLDTRFHFVVVEDGDEAEIIGHNVKFFDIHSTKAKQFGFCITDSDGEKITCCGDEPYNECYKDIAEGSKWLFHEAFCLYSERDIFDPYEKHHSTVKDACQLAESLGVKNLLIYHTEEKNLKNRKEMYTAEGKPYYHGNLIIPDDLEVIDL